MEPLAFILFVIAVIGMFKPHLVLPFNKDKSRKKVLLYYGIALVVVLFIVGNQSNTSTDSSVITNEPIPDAGTGKRIFEEILLLEKEARITSQALYPVYGSELSVGSTFILSEETRMMKDLNPQEGIEVLKDLILLEIGVSIEVLKSIDSPRSFRVKVKDSGNEGFILRSALDAQTVVDQDKALGRQVNHFYRLKEQADSIILTKHGLTQNQLDSLELVGIKQGWIN